MQAVADTGSFVGAARVIHRTPSAISMQSGIQCRIAVVLECRR
ncbi:hypothetical protein [Mesorhizobium sp.]|nr:hypothetical protein [Mesorhizobium sp.]